MWLLSSAIVRWCYPLTASGASDERSRGVRPSRSARGAAGAGASSRAGDRRRGCGPGRFGWRCEEWLSHKGIVGQARLTVCRQAPYFSGRAPRQTIAKAARHTQRSQADSPDDERLTRRTRIKLVIDVLSQCSHRRQPYQRPSASFSLNLTRSLLPRARGPKLPTCARKSPILPPKLAPQTCAGWRLQWRLPKALKCEAPVLPVFTTRLKGSLLA